MATELKMSSKGDKQIKIKLSRIAKGLKNPRPVLKIIGIKLINEINKYFVQQGNAGEGWEPLQDYGGSFWKRRKILFDTGKLRASFLFQLKGKHAVEVGSPVKYAEIHQFGTDTTPARPMLPKEKIASKIAEKQIVRYINRLKEKKM